MRSALRKALYTGLVVAGGLLALSVSRADAQQAPVAPAVPPNQVYQTAPSYYPVTPRYNYTYMTRPRYRLFGGRRLFYGGPQYYRNGRPFGWRRLRSY